MESFPEIVQVVPFPDYTVSVYFADGKIVSYDVKPKLDLGVFRALQDPDIFLHTCTIMNDTLAWDYTRTGDPTACIDIAPDMLYSLSSTEDRLAS